MTPFEAFYVRPCRSPSSKLDNKDSMIAGPELIEDAARQVELIKKLMNEAQDRQKSCVDLKKTLELMVGKLIFLKISPIEG